jgi:hypothetical protein
VPLQNQAYDPNRCQEKRSKEPERHLGGRMEGLQNRRICPAALAGGSVAFAAPVLIVHYIEKQGYLPPPNCYWRSKKQLAEMCIHLSVTVYAWMWQLGSERMVVLIRPILICGRLLEKSSGSYE